MAITRADVLDSIIALGLSEDEADQELRGREAEAMKLVAAASPDERAAAIREARAILSSARLLYVARPKRPRFLQTLQFRRPKPPRWLRSERIRRPRLPAMTKRQAGAAIGVAVVVLAGLSYIAVAGLPGGHGKSVRAETLGDRSEPLLPPPPSAPHVAQAPAFEMMYTLSKKRPDGGKTLYVLIDPVDISTADFKDDLKLLIRDLIGQYGPSTTIEIHDDPNSLRASYQRFGEKSVRTPMTPEEAMNEALHFVAAYSGNLSTGMFLNTLQFYSAATSDTPLVGQYTEDAEFDPTQ